MVAHRPAPISWRTRRRDAIIGLAQLVCFFLVEIVSCVVCMCIHHLWMCIFAEPRLRAHGLYISNILYTERLDWCCGDDDNDDDDDEEAILGSVDNDRKCSARDTR